MINVQEMDGYGIREIRFIDPRFPEPQKATSGKLIAIVLAGPGNPR
jgi:hypothetical protein